MAYGDKDIVLDQIHEKEVFLDFIRESKFYEWLKKMYCILYNKVLVKLGFSATIILVRIFI